MRARIRKAMEEKDQGFTLIELLVVMIIIGILAAIAVPVFLNQRTKAVDSSIKSDLKTVATNLETYAVDAQAYPAAADVTQTGGAGKAVVVGSGGASVAVSNGNNITYVLSKDGKGFCLGGWNDKANANATTKQYWYYSQSGGLQSLAGAKDSNLCA